MLWGIIFLPKNWQNNVSSVIMFPIKMGAEIVFIALLRPGIALDV